MVACERRLPVSDRLRLVQGWWVRLPGTPYELLLKGKFRDHTDVTDLRRTGGHLQTGGWDLTLVMDRVLIRRVDR